LDIKKDQNFILLTKKKEELSGKVFNFRES
jgi:hypothetical protein